MIIRRLTFLLIILLFVFPLGSYGADGKIGIVLLHGKQDRAPYKIASLANRLKDEGYLVATPEMPWSRSRRSRSGMGMFTGQTRSHSPQSTQRRRPSAAWASRE